MKHRIAHWTFDEGVGHTAEDSVSGISDAINFALLKGRFQTPLNPVWTKGVKGEALSFDGYSTFICRNSNLISRPSDELAISVWVAPRAYDSGDEGRLSAIVNQHSREMLRGYVFGLFKHGRWSLQLGTGDQWIEIWSPVPVPLNQWSFLTAVYNGREGWTALYLNGEKVAESVESSPSKIILASVDLMIGRNNNGVVLAEAFTLNNYNGWMDDLIIFDEALSDADIKQMYEGYLSLNGGTVPRILPQNMEIPRSYYRSDRHRPQYHMSPPGHWMNEPHAPLYFKGQYHIFYQHNPNGPFYHNIHWGHAVSKDLVHWRDLPIALRPEPGLDPDGIWSGSAVLDENGLPALFYTIGNNEQSPNQSIGIARSILHEDANNDLKKWKKNSKPVLRQEKDIGLYGEFRDPFVWKENDVYFMLVGSGTGAKGEGGTALVYTSHNLLEWFYRGPLYISNYGKYPFLGTAWELPVLLPLRKKDGTISGKHVLLISPWGEGAKVEVNYWIGNWNPQVYRFEPEQEEPGLIDVGKFHFTGPSGMVDPQTGRSLLFTIAQGERTPAIDYDCGWAHGAGMPVSLYLRNDGQLGIEPIQETSLLRTKCLVSLKDARIGEINKTLANITGDSLEIILEFVSGKSDVIGISLRRSPNGEEETVILFNRSRQQLLVDRTKATLDKQERTRGVQGGSLPIGEENLKLHIFIDRSLIECYANNLKSLTTRVYPSKIDALGLMLVGDDLSGRANIEIWKMESSYQF